MTHIICYVLSPIDKTDRNWRKCLRNPMLFAKLDERLLRLNGDCYDPAMIDTSLEYAEALGDIKRRHPEIRTFESEDDIPP